MKKKKDNGIKYYVVISLVAVFAVAGCVAAYSMSQNVNVSGDYNYYEAEGQVAPEEINLGASPGPERYADRFCENGVCREYHSIVPVAATNTPCSIKAPSSTSTLIFASVKFDLASTTASNWQWHQSATAYATTTDLSSLYAIGAGPDLVMASSSPGDSGYDSTAVQIFAPNEYLVLWGQNTIPASTYTFTNGSCKAEFLVL